ncbi:MAG: lanthionine synthetase LanC family protein, partial [Bacteroidota bacterium]
MSNTLIQTSIQPEAIGEWLVHNAQASSTGLSWSFSYPSDPHQYLPEQAESLDREGGIIYFLLELYSCTKKAHYLKTALGVLEALLEHCAQTSTGNYSPFTGRSSLLVLLIKAHEVTTDQSYLKQALQLIQTFDHEAYLKSEYSANGFYHGRAGVLLNYLRLYQLTSDAELLQLIVDYTLAVCKGADNKPAGRLVWP